MLASPTLTSDASMFVAIFSTSFLIGILIGFIAMGVAFWKIFAKAGQPGWAAIIPIYNIFVLLKIVRKPWWWFFLFFVPGIYLIPMILIPLELGKAFGKSTSFTVLWLLLIPIGMYVIAFDESKYLYGVTNPKPETPLDTPPVQPGITNPLSPEKTVF